MHGGLAPAVAEARALLDGKRSFQDGAGEEFKVRNGRSDHSPLFVLCGESRDEIYRGA